MERIRVVQHLRNFYSRSGIRKDTVLEKTVLDETIVVLVSVTFLPLIGSSSSVLPRGVGFLSFLTLQRKVRLGCEGRRVDPRARSKTLRSRLSGERRI